MRRKARDSGSNCALFLPLCRHIGLLFGKFKLKVDRSAMGSSPECKLLIVSWASVSHASGYRLQVECKSSVLNVMESLFIKVINFSPIIGNHSFPAAVSSIINRDQEPYLTE